MDLQQNSSIDDFTRELIQAQEQRSQGWRDARAGRFTASEIWKLMGSPKGGKEWTDTAMTYILTKVAEEITGYVHQTSNAYPLVWGEEQEPIAKAVYEQRYGEKIEPATFNLFTDHAGGTPDGYIGERLVEIKCPYNSANHIQYLQCSTQLDILDIRPEYYWQIQTNMLFCKMSVGLFIAYDPRFTEPMDLHCIPFTADVEHQQMITDRLGKAIEKKLEIIKMVKRS